jgi:serine/threonine-protein kinase
LEAVLTPEEQARVQAPPTADLEAYELNLVGRHRWVYRSADNLHDAIRFFEAAVDKDSTFALAWAGLADAWTALPWYEPMPSPEAYARGWQAAQRAFDLEPDLAEAHAALGALLVWHEWDWGRGEGHLRRAVALNPSHAPSHHLLAVALGLGGQLDLAIQHMREAIRLNPLGNNYRFTLANLLYYDGKPDQARAVYERAEEAELLVPWGILEASIFYMQQGLDEEAFGAIRRWGELVSYPDPERLTVVLRAFESPELTEEAVRTLEDVRRTTGMQAGDLVRLYLNLDAPDEALSVLREAIARRHVVVPTLGGPHTRAGVLASAEITAALGEAGVPIWEGAYQGKPPSINR